MSEELQATRDRAAEHTSSALTLRTELEAFEIESPDDRASFEELVRSCRAKVKAIEEERLKISRPLDQALKALRALFRPPIDAWSAVEQLCRAKILAYETARAEEQAARERALAEEIAAKAQAEGLTPDAAIDALCVVGEELEVAQEEEPAAGSCVVKSWDAEVVDLRALVEAVVAGAAPLELVRADDSAVRIFARAHGETASVPGVRFFQKSSLRVKS
jgi:hypothetical protein